VARGIYGIKDYRGEFRNVKTQLADENRYIFDMGNPVMYKRYTYYSIWDGKSRIETGYFSKASKIYSVFGFYNTKPYVIQGWSRDSIIKAVYGTPFQYSTWEKYEKSSCDMTIFFGLYSKHPCIEYLTKMGLHECVEDKFNGYYTYGAINWNGKSIEKVLKLTKNQFKAIKNSGAEIDMQLLKLYQITLSEGTNLSPEEINKIKRDFSFVSMKDLDPVRKFSTLSKVHSFACNQYEINRSLKERHYYDIRDVIIGYKDYLKDCMTLEMDMKSESVLFPKNLYNAH
jgi:hypothetical protein